MPPKRARRTRASERAKAEAGKVENAESDGIIHPATEEKGDSVNGATSTPLSPDAEPKENGPQVNGNAQPKSAAQKKREKRKQRKRDGSVMSEVSDAERVSFQKQSG